MHAWRRDIAFSQDKTSLPFLAIFFHSPAETRVSSFGVLAVTAVEMHENWLEAMRYLNIDHLREHKKQRLRQGA
jgi:hypothetical protein